MENKQFTVDYLDLLFFLEKSIMRGEITQKEMDETLKGVNPYKFKYRK